MKLMLKIVGGIVIASVLLVAGCTALLAAGANEVQADSDKHAITAKQFASIKAGMKRTAVEAKLGAPDNVQETDIEGFDKTTAEFDCIYYNRKGEVLSMYQFCFDNGKLTSKSSY